MGEPQRQEEEVLPSTSTASPPPKRGPWSHRENLALVCGVISGGNNWPKIAAIMEDFAECKRPSDYFTSGTCQTQFTTLAQNVDDGDYTRSYEQVAELLVKHLQSVYAEFLKVEVSGALAKYDALRTAINEVEQNTLSDERLNSIYDTFITGRHTPVEELSDNDVYSESGEENNQDVVSETTKVEDSTLGAGTMFEMLKNSQFLAQSETASDLDFFGTENTSIYQESASKALTTLQNASMVRTQASPPRPSTSARSVPLRKQVFKGRKQPQGNKKRIQSQKIESLSSASDSLRPQWIDRSSESDIEVVDLTSSPEKTEFGIRQVQDVAETVDVVTSDSSTILFTGQVVTMQGIAPLTDFDGETAIDPSLQTIGSLEHGSDSRSATLRDSISESDGNDSLLSSQESESGSGESSQHSDSTSPDISPTKPEVPFVRIPVPPGTRPVTFFTIVSSDGKMLGDESSLDDVEEGSSGQEIIHFAEVEEGSSEITVTDSATILTSTLEEQAEVEVTTTLDEDQCSNSSHISTGSGMEVGHFEYHEYREYGTYRDFDEDHDMENLKVQSEIQLEVEENQVEDVDKAEESKVPDQVGDNALNIEVKETSVVETTEESTGAEHLEDASVEGKAETSSEAAPQPLAAEEDIEKANNIEDSAKCIPQSTPDQQDSHNEQIDAIAKEEHEEPKVTVGDEIEQDVETEVPMDASIPDYSEGEETQIDALDLSTKKVAVEQDSTENNTPEHDTTEYDTTDHDTTGHDTTGQGHDTTAHDTTETTDTTLEIETTLVVASSSKSVTPTSDKTKKKRGSGLQRLYKEAGTYFPSESFSMGGSLSSGTPGTRVTRARRQTGNSIGSTAKKTQRGEAPPSASASSSTVVTVAPAPAHNEAHTPFAFDMESVKEIVATVKSKVLAIEQTQAKTQQPKEHSLKTESQSQKRKFLSKLDKISALKESSVIKRKAKDGSGKAALAKFFKSDISLSSLQNSVKTGLLTTEAEVKSDLSLMLLNASIQKKPGLKVLSEKIWTIMNTGGETSFQKAQESATSRSRQSSTSTSGGSKVLKRAGRSLAKESPPIKRGLRSSSAGTQEQESETTLRPNAIASPTGSINAMSRRGSPQPGSSTSAKETIPYLRSQRSSSAKKD